MKLALTTVTLLSLCPSFSAFVLEPSVGGRTLFAASRKQHSSALYAIGALAKKAKQTVLRKYVEDGVEDNVMEKYNILKEKKDQIDLSTLAAGPLQLTLTRRKGTITVIAEYKRKNDQCEHGYINDIYDPEILSPTFREFGASAIAVMADERMGGCSYDDLKAFCVEQSRASQEVPGPVKVINNDLVIDELQLAQTAACGAHAVVFTMSVVGEEELPDLLKAAAALDLESIVSVGTVEEGQKAIDLGARMLLVNAEGVDAKVEIVKVMNVPEDRPVCMIANIIAKRDKSLQEIEEAWAVRDKGFNAAWIGDALYKTGLETEHPGAIIKSMKSKSSLKWATPKATSGRGEGAREYLGDIMM